VSLERLKGELEAIAGRRRSEHALLLTVARVLRDRIDGRANDELDRHVLDVAIAVKMPQGPPEPECPI
jgi:hypothetical protein